ncbi:MAG: DUF1697 domain-containing protein [Bryobacterales bacterium]|nr:DUF1697 domain-containing protein [Bryobacterales bacterium]
MTTWIALLRGINVGGHHKIPMESLRELCAQLGFTNPRTYIQSGNIVFGSPQRKSPTLANEIEQAIESTFGFLPAVILRSATELRSTVEANPFPHEAQGAPSKLTVLFLREQPAHVDPIALESLGATGEQLRLTGRDLFVYYPTGMGQSKLPIPRLERALRSAGGEPNPGTTRNWNTVRKLLAMAQES